MPSFFPQLVPNKRPEKKENKAVAYIGIATAVFLGLAGLFEAIQITLKTGVSLSCAIYTFSLCPAYQPPSTTKTDSKLETNEALNNAIEKFLDAEKKLPKTIRETEQ